MKKFFVIIVVIAGFLFIEHNVYAWRPFEQDIHEAKVTDQVELIDIHVSGASATLIRDKGNSIRAELDGKGKLKVNKRGDTVSVTYKRNCFDGLPFFNHSKLTIYIPEDYNQNLQIDIGSGTLKNSGFTKKNPLKLDELTIDLGSGNVNLKNIITKTYQHDVSSGNLQIDSLKTENGTLDISSGNVDLKHFSGALETDISSGNLDVQMDKLEGNINIDISSGKASLDLPRNADFKLNGDISSGNIENEFPLKEQVKDKDHIKGTYGSGKYKINVDVSSGSIDIR